MHDVYHAVCRKRLGRSLGVIGIDAGGHDIDIHYIALDSSWWSLPVSTTYASAPQSIDLANVYSMRRPYTAAQLHRNIRPQRQSLVSAVPEIDQSPTNLPIRHAVWQSGSLKVHRSSCTVDENTRSSDVFQEVETNKQKEGRLWSIVERAADWPANQEIGLRTQDANRNRKTQLASLGDKLLSFASRLASFLHPAYFGISWAAEPTALPCVGHQCDLDNEHTRTKTTRTTSQDKA